MVMAGDHHRRKGGDSDLLAVDAVEA